MNGQAAIVTLGDFFFRWRSYLPLLVLPLLAVAIARFQYPLSSHGVDLTWEGGSLVVALIGQALRVWSVGVAAPGTSGRNTRQQKAAILNVTGPYSIVRHPLYLGNALIALGLAMFPHTWMSAPVVALLAAGYYACIAKREDAYLRERFGEQFVIWAARVPAFVPNWRLYVPPDRPFDPWRVVRREFYGVAVILITPLAIDVAEDAISEGVLTFDPVWVTTAAVGAAIFAVLRTIKKRQG